MLPKEERLWGMESLGLSTMSNVVNSSSSSSLKRSLWAESPGMKPMLLRRFSLVSDCSGRGGVATGTVMVGGYMTMGALSTCTCSQSRGPKAVVSLCTRRHEL